MKETKDIKWIYLAYSIMWISVSIAVCFTVYYTKSVWGLFIFCALGMPSINSETKEKEVGDK